jgi:hypothetical protein
MRKIKTCQVGMLVGAAGSSYDAGHREFGELGWEVGWRLDGVGYLIRLIKKPSKDNQSGRISGNSRCYPIGWISY